MGDTLRLLWSAGRGISTGLAVIRMWTGGSGRP